uniref:Uncharacterized protein n=1 Tax=Chelonoidis abingdonii TaxID=106734 RepID=A0A8C0GMJ5_CHEAB
LLLSFLSLVLPRAGSMGGTVPEAWVPSPVTLRTGNMRGDVPGWEHGGHRPRHLGPIPGHPEGWEHGGHRPGRLGPIPGHPEGWAVWGALSRSPGSHPRWGQGEGGQLGGTLGRPSPPPPKCQSQPPTLCRHPQGVPAYSAPHTPFPWGAHSSSPKPQISP